MPTFLKIAVVLLVLLLAPLLTINAIGVANRVEADAPRPVSHDEAPATFDRGVEAMLLEDFDLAESLFRSIPEDHALYAKAQRFVGWELRAERRDDAAAGVLFVNRAILADPTDGNVWQDAWRTYRGTLADIVD